jgi:hypothetical protein
MTDREPPGILGVAGLRIEDCTPQVRVSGNAVRYALSGRYGYNEPGTPLLSDRLAIRAIGGQAIYRIGAYHPEDDTFEAEWPD